jgi:uncharacterized protein (DUF2267 family)
MTYDEFVGQVQHRAKLSSTEDAVRAIRCTLQTLGQRLAGDEADNLASQLPREIGIFLTQNSSEEGVRLSLDQFFQTVCDCEGAELPDSVYHARVVIEVLTEAVTIGELEDAIAQLPPEFNELFAAGSQGELRRG